MENKIKRLIEIAGLFDKKEILVTVTESEFDELTKSFMTSEESSYSTCLECDFNNIKTIYFAGATLHFNLVA